MFDELQKKAVEEYKSSPVAVPSGDKASSDAVNPLPPKALILEEQLEVGVCNGIEWNGGGTVCSRGTSLPCQQRIYLVHQLFMG